MNNPEKVKATCPYCDKPLRFKLEEKNLIWKFGQPSAQKDLLSWYFYCGCANGEKWTWCCHKENNEWRYHDWSTEEWRDEIPEDKQKVQFT